MIPKKSDILMKSYASSAQQKEFSKEEIVELVKNLSEDDTKKYQAISKIIENENLIPNLPIILWYSSATATSLLCDITSFYPSLGQVLSKEKSLQITNLLRIIYIIAKSPDVKLPFVRANFPIYLFPYIQVSLKNTETYHIAAAALAVFSTLVADSNPEVIKYLINADFLPIIRTVLNLQNPQMQTVGAYILTKILCDTDGRISLLSNTHNITIIMKILCHRFVQLATNYIPDLAEYITLSLSLILPLPEVQKVFYNVIGNSLDSISLPLKFDPKYKEVFSQMKGILANYQK